MPSQSRASRDLRISMRCAGRSIANVRARAPHPQPDLEGDLDSPSALSSLPERIVLHVEGADPAAIAAGLGSLTMPALVAQGLAADVARAISDGQVVHAECRYLSEGGQRLMLHYEILPAAGHPEQVQVNVEVRSIVDEEEGPACDHGHLMDLLEASGNLAYIKDLQGRYLAVSASLVTLYGLPREEIVGYTDREMFGPGLADRIWADEQRVVEAEQPVEVEGPLPGGGEERLYRSTRFLLSDRDGGPYALCSLSADVSERRTAEVRLSRSAERIMALNRCFLGFGPDPEENMRSLTALCRDLLGGACALYVRKHKAVISSWGLWNAPPDGPERDSLARMEGRLCYELLLSQDERVTLVRDLPDTPYAETDPNVIQFDLRAYVGRSVRLGGHTLGAVCVVFQKDYDLADEDGRLLGIVASALAVEERRLRAEERQDVAYRIAEAATRSAGLYELGTYIHQEIDRILDARNFYIALLDPESGQILFPYLVDETISPEESRRAMASACRGGLSELVIRQGTHLLLSEDEIRTRVRHGEARVLGEVPLVWLGVPLKEGDETIGMMAVQNYASSRAYDASDVEFLSFVSGQIAAAVRAKRSEEALHESEARYRLLAENVSDIIWVRDLDLTPIYVSASVERMLGYTVKEALEQSIEEALTPASAEEARRTVADALAAPDEPRERTLELEHRTRDGGTLWAEVKMTFLSDARGRPNRVLGVARDVTRRRELERQFRQANKIESLGQLAGGIAHHFNNLLTVINGYSQFMIGSLDDANPLRRDAEAILKAGRRAAELTRQLLDFSRRRVIHPEVVNLNALLRRTADMLASVIGENINLRLSLPERLPSVRADPGQIEQILLNLAVNARDAMPQGGMLELSTFTADATTLAEAGISGAGAPCYVAFAVRDTGSGMSEAVREHLFEPFFTTKEVGEGTGLGLATVYGIVTQMGGHVTVDSGPGEGTTFTVYLPAVDEEPLAVTSAGRSSGADALPGGTERVLVIEGEDDLRDLTARMLRRLGYGVLEARDGRSAVEVAALADRPLDLVLTDVSLSDGPATDVVRDLRGASPQLRALFMTGYGEAGAIARDLESCDTGLIAKPFALARLAQRVRELLDRRQRN